MGNELHCKSCDECRQSEILNYGRQRETNSLSQYSMQAYTRLSRVDREEYIRQLERHWLADRENAFSRKGKIKAAILKAPETISDLQRAVREAAMQKEESMIPSRYGGFEESTMPLGISGLQGPKSLLHQNDLVIQSMTIPDVGEYEGETLNDKPHGKGKLKYLNSDMYEGDLELMHRRFYSRQERRLRYPSYIYRREVSRSVD